MKTRLLALLLALPALRAGAQEYILRQAHFRYAQILPSSNIFKDGYGLEGTIRHWKWDTTGYGLSLGLNDYSLDGGADFAQSLRAGATIQGSAGYIPLQASFLYAPIRTHAVDVNLEFGLRYMVALTSADVVIPLGESQTSLPIDIADAITAIGAAHLEYRFGSGYSAVLGLGVQQDVVQGEYGVSDVVAGKAELSGAFIHLGMAVDL